MIFHYCTYFDRNYLYRGLALYRSMVRHFPAFTLWILCFDQETYAILDRLALPSVRLIRLESFEDGDDALLRAKAGRTPVEYLWTCTPSLPLFVFRQAPSLDGVVYLDADFFFFHDPSSIFEELGTNSIFIHPHRYTPENAGRTETNGIYNVGILVFRNDEAGLACLRWWRDRCNEWCFYREECGKFGDQKYLDDWPTRFERVVVSQHKGVGLAPWNITQYKLSICDGRVCVDDLPVVCYHFHRIELVGWGGYKHSNYPLTDGQVDTLYVPYMREINSCIGQVRKVVPDFRAGYSRPSLKQWINLVRYGQLRLQLDWGILGR